MQHNKQHQRNVLLNSFHLNDHTLGFHPQTQNLNHRVQHNEQHHRKVLLYALRQVQKRMQHFGAHWFLKRSQYH